MYRDWALGAKNRAWAILGSLGASASATMSFQMSFDSPAPYDNIVPCNQIRPWHNTAYVENYHGPGMLLLWRNCDYCLQFDGVLHLQAILSSRFVKVISSRHWRYIPYTCLDNYLASCMSATLLLLYLTGRRRLMTSG